jgi:hypothetical protein
MHSSNIIACVCQHFYTSLSLHQYLRTFFIIFKKNTKTKEKKQQKKKKKKKKKTENTFKNL